MDGPPEHKHFTTGMSSASFTSTALKPTTVSGRRKYTSGEVRSKYHKLVKANLHTASVTLETTHGNFRFTLWCHLTPFACENFIELCEEEYFANTSFHRNVPGFVLQGGDPTGQGTGGKNIFGLPFFNDEFHPTLRHSKRGVLSMANSGPNTNKSQFFVTYSAVPHLDNKHTVFGELTEGFDALATIEDLPTDKKGRFKDGSVTITRCQVHNNPFRECKTEVLRSLNATLGEDEEDWFEIPKALNVPKPQHKGVGKYLPKKRTGQQPAGLYADYPSKKTKRTGFDFSNW